MKCDNTNKPTTTESFYMIADKKRFCDHMDGFAIFDNKMEVHTFDGCYCSSLPPDTKITGFACMAQATAISSKNDAEQALKALSGNGKNHHDLVIVEVNATYSCRMLLDTTELETKGVAI